MEKRALRDGGKYEYGDINKVDTTGASPATARQDKLPFSGGVDKDAGMSIAHRNQRHLSKLTTLHRRLAGQLWTPFYESVMKLPDIALDLSDLKAGASTITLGVPASREMAKTDSRRMTKYKGMIHQAGSDSNMDPAVIAGIISRETRAGGVIGPDGFGADGHGYGIMQVDDRYHKLKGGPYSLEHIKQGTGILIDMIRAISAKFPTWSKDMALKGGISAYNAGPRNVKTYDRMDVGTTGNDYANDVTARSQWYSANGF